MGKRGRPAFKPSAANRRKVEELRSCGMSEDSIARAMGISTPTLQKYFAEEILNGAAKKRAEHILMLHRSARKGNVSAQKHLEAMSRAVVLAEGAMGERPRGEAEKEEVPIPQGKKEQAAAAAKRVASSGGKYSPPAPPTLVVDNS